MENRKWRTGIDEAHQAKRLMSNWNPRNGSELYKSAKDSSGHWTVWYNQPEKRERKTIVLDADKFSDLQGFYQEIDRVLRKNKDRVIRHNFSTLNDLLRGGSRVMKYEEPIVLVWKNSRKSMRELGLKNNSLWAVGESFFQILTSMISQHDHIELNLE